MAIITQSTTAKDFEDWSKLIFTLQRRRSKPTTLRRIYTNHDQISTKFKVFALQIPLRSSLRLLLAAEQIEIRIDFWKSGRNSRTLPNRSNFTMECALGLDGGVTRVFVDRFLVTLWRKSRWLVRWTSPADYWYGWSKFLDFSVEIIVIYLPST